MQEAYQKPVAVGKNGKYETHVKPFLEDIKQWLMDGMTEYSICEQLGIHHQTWINYKRRHIALIEAIARAKEEKNALVMHKMLEKATGYEHEDLYITQHKGQIIEKKIKKHYAPCDKAAELYLRNNMEGYKSGREPVISNTLNINMDMSPSEQRERILQLLQEQRKQMQPAKKVEAIEADYQIEEPDENPGEPPY